MTRHILQIIDFSVAGEKFTTEIEVESPELSEQTLSEIASQQDKVNT